MCSYSTYKDKLDNGRNVAKPEISKHGRVFKKQSSERVTDTESFFRKGINETSGIPSCNTSATIAVHLFGMLQVILWRTCSHTLVIAAVLIGRTDIPTDGHSRAESKK